MQQAGDGSARLPFIRAAGGILWRTRERREVAVIFRDRHAPDECSLPKGKLDPGEDWGQAALREVREETGSRGEVVGFGGTLTYYVGARPKVVVYLEMIAAPGGRFRPSREVREMAWLTPDEALAALSHESERQMLRALVRSALPGEGPRKPGKNSLARGA